MRFTFDLRLSDNENETWNSVTKRFDATETSRPDVHHRIELEIPNGLLGAFGDDIVAVSNNAVSEALREYHNSDPAKQPKEEHSNHQEIPNPEALGELPF